MPPVLIPNPTAGPLAMTEAQHTPTRKDFTMKAKHDPHWYRLVAFENKEIDPVLGIPIQR